MQEICLEELFKIIPYNSYFDLFQAIKNRKAEIRFSRTTCTQISSVTNPNTNIGMLLGFLVTAILLVFYSIYFNFYWNLLLIPINFFLSLFIDNFPILNKASWFILILSIFIRINSFLIILSINILLISFFYNKWWNKTFRNAINVLENNTDAFIWAWNRNGLTIIDTYGNMYFSFHNKVVLNDNSVQEPIKDNYIYCDELDEEKSILLSAVVVKQTNANSIDDAINIAISGYGLDNIKIDLTNKEKTLAKIVMLGTEAQSLEEAIIFAKQQYELEDIDLENIKEEYLKESKTNEETDDTK